MARASEGANNMRPLSWGGAQTEKIQSRLPLCLTDHSKLLEFFLLLTEQLKINLSIKFWFRKIIC